MIKKLLDRIRGKNMKKSELRQMIREELLQEGPKWVTNNIDKNMYNFWASGDLLFSNLSHYMDDMNADKQEDALFSLKVTYEESVELLKYLKKYLPQIKNELKEKGRIR